MKPMLLTPANELPIGEEWLYEVKYDGFRCILVWDETPTLVSRNGHDLTHQFPEIIQHCLSLNTEMAPFLPLTMDGELVYLVNPFKSDFATVQTRGRMKAEKVIIKHVENYPCTYIAFDLLQIKGVDLTKSPLTQRKSELQQLQLNGSNNTVLRAIDVYNEADLVWDTAVTNNGEGVIAKRKTSDWIAGKRTNQWLKIKNWKYVTVVLTTYNNENGFFHGSVYLADDLVEITVFSHGMTDEDRMTLVEFFQTKGTQIAQDLWALPPSICVDIACIDFDGKKLREPRFHKFNFETAPEQVNWKKMQRQLHPIPPIIQITHPEKPVWPAVDINKDDYIFYLQQISPHFMPFLQDRLLTAIRFPHGVPRRKLLSKKRT